MPIKNIHALCVLAILFLFFPINSPAQIKNTNYTTQWKKVEELINKELTKSASEEVTKIYEAAKESKNDPQVIRALIYRINLQQNVEEDANVKSIITVEKEITTATQPAKSILRSISAGMYLNFFQQNRWKLYDRTKTYNFIKEDIETWNAEDFHKKIGELYL